ncbi:unnamed protein product, partial [marine sediment metagenome]
MTEAEAEAEAVRDLTKSIQQEKEHNNLQQEQQRVPPLKQPKPRYSSSSCPTLSVPEPSLSPFDMQSFASHLSSREKHMLSQGRMDKQMADKLHMLLSDVTEKDEGLVDRGGRGGIAREKEKGVEGVWEMKEEVEGSWREKKRGDTDDVGGVIDSLASTFGATPEGVQRALIYSTIGAVA